MFLIAQFIGLLAFLITIISYHLKTKPKILITMSISNILDIIHYFLLGAKTGYLTKIIAFIRNNFIIIKEKHPKLSNKIFLYLFIVTYLIIGLTTYENIFSILPLIAAIIYITNIWNGNELTIKKTACACYFLWLLYNIFILSISGLISNIISIISTLIAYKTEKNKLQSNIKNNY